MHVAPEGRPSRQRCHVRRSRCSSVHCYFLHSSNCARITNGVGDASVMSGAARPRCCRRWRAALRRTKFTNRNAGKSRWRWRWWAASRHSRRLRATPTSSRRASHVCVFGTHYERVCYCQWSTISRASPTSIPRAPRLCDFPALFQEHHCFGVVRCGIGLLWYVAQAGPRLRIFPCTGAAAGGRSFRTSGPVSPGRRKDRQGGAA